jgi:hypothetical protein
LAPEEYALDGKEFVRLDTRAIVRAFGTHEQAEYEKAIDGGCLREAQQMIRRFWQRSRRPQGGSPFERFRAGIGESSMRELRQIIEQPDRRGEVLALPRNPYTGAVVIPGSSIKGAIRTALASWLANTGEGPQRIAEARRTRGEFDGRRMEEAVFGYTPSEMEGDPLRLLHVADSEWPASGVQVDKPELTKLGRDRGMTQGIQMHVERLVSRGDRGETPAAEVTIRVEPARGRPVARVFSWEEIVFACNRFYANRLNAEHRRFAWVAADGERWQPSQQEFERGILLRIGRSAISIRCRSTSTGKDGTRPGRRRSGRSDTRGRCAR